jgi:Trehalose utilisation
VHASIPLAAKAVEALGNQGGLWTTTVSYDAADINTDNLKKYDAIFLDSTTACFLDDPDPSVTAARRAAFLNFVRAGKGVAGIHAATDSYHTDCLASEAAATSGSPGQNRAAVVLAARLVTERTRIVTIPSASRSGPPLPTTGSKSWIQAIPGRSPAPILWRTSIRYFPRRTCVV